MAEESSGEKFLLRVCGFKKAPAPRGGLLLPALPV